MQSDKAKSMTGYGNMPAIHNLNNQSNGISEMIKDGPKLGKYHEDLHSGSGRISPPDSPKPDHKEYRHAEQSEYSNDYVLS